MQQPGAPTAIGARSGQSQRKGQRQRQRRGQQRRHGCELETRQAPLRKTGQRQADAAVAGFLPDQLGQQRQWQHEAEGHRHGAQAPGQQRQAALQHHRPAFVAAARAGEGATGGKAQVAACTALGPQQPGHQQQQQRGQLGRGDAVVHHQPGLVDAGRERGQAEVGANAIVGQRLHQGQRHAGHQGRPRQRQCHRADAPPQAGAEQAGGLHHLHAAFGQRGAHQQVDIRVQAEHEQHHRTGQAAHVGPQRALQPGDAAQRALQRTAELEEVGVGVGQHVGRHGHRQQQGPLEDAPARELEQGHGRCRAAAEQRYADRHTGGQQQRLQRVAGQHGLRLVHQHRPGSSIEGQPGAEHAEHRHGEQQADQGQQDAHRGGTLQMRIIRILM